ncbi:PREDICTED: uncharacterized protein LOC104825178 [Tarenaya hassleriana]|uniref:uncharacterized protein LOC104825178 n=1 Tax=Tarenaya hassleriana TaxID=28532 RepID=UPI00053C284C|nr:PREDICTED: uncharacterized protein LOC104825178 [Tarenaya hassleriana]
MKRNNRKHKSKSGGEDQEQEQKRLEVVKAVAQAWLSRSNTTTTSSCWEFGAQRRYGFIRDKPSRFKIEALSITAGVDTDDHRYRYPTGSRWDFGQSLWDSYEIVAVSKKLERGLALENAFSGFVGDNDDGEWSRLIGLKKKKKKTKGEESRNSLRSLFYRACSRRFNNVDVNSPES